MWLTGVVGRGSVRAATAAIVLEVAGRLDGPSLLPWGVATLETYVGAVLGVLVAVVAVSAGLTASRN